jgi:hypothetical protein
MEETFAAVMGRLFALFLADFNGMRDLFRAFLAHRRRVSARRGVAGLF